MKLKRFKLHFDESVAREVDQVKIIETAACQQLFGHGLKLAQSSEWVALGGQGNIETAFVVSLFYDKHRVKYISIEFIDSSLEGWLLQFFGININTGNIDPSSDLRHSIRPHKRCLYLFDQADFLISQSKTE
jgi:hypothetical protein